MASWICLSLCIVAAIVSHQVSGTTLTITPNPVPIGGANPTSLNGTCRPPTQANLGYSIDIGRRRITTSEETFIVNIALSGNGDDAPVIQDGSLRSRLTVQGSIQGTAPFLTFSLRDPTCEDIRDYTFFCTTQFRPLNAGSNEDSKNITYNVNPGNVQMIVFPNYEIYEPPILVTFTCTALIGSNYPSDQSSFWVWEWRDTSDLIPTSWQRYPYTSNITYGTPTTAANCNHNGRSELRHTVSDLDNGREFRCYIVNPDLYSANKTILFEDDTTPGGTGAVNDEPASADVGMIVGIIIGVLAAIAIVIVLVYFLVFKRRSGGGDDYDTGEGKGDRPEMTVSDVYSTPASMGLRGKGQENDGLDEPHEPRKPYYNNDFGDRGRANPAMDNDSRHDRSFDDDNTDSRIRSPYGSAV